MKNIRHYFILRSELRGFLGVLLICTCSGVNAEQKLSADWVKTLLLNDQTQRNYRGSVVYEDSLRQLTVKADSAHVRVGDAIYLFVHQVSYKDTVREIRADTLVFQDREDRATFRGHVFLSDDQRTLEAHSVQFLSKEDSLIAEGDVILLLPEGRRLRASQLRYDLIRERGNLQGQTQLQVAEENGDTLEAQSDSIALVNRGRELLLNGNLILRQGHMRGKARSGAYADSAIVLSGRPLMTWTNPSRRDSVSAQGTKILMDVSDQIINTMVLSDSTRIHAMALANGHAQKIKIRSDSARIVFRDETPQRMHAWGSVILNLSERDTSRAVLSGDDLKVAYRDGKLDSLTLSGDCIGSYIAQDSLSESRLRGKKFVLWFSNGELAQMAISDEAYCTRITRDSDDVTVSGDYLLLKFTPGQLSSIRAEGAVRGHYTAELEDAP
ncbi:MAG: hypothetical protein F4W91_03855 [Gemmatimonadetes bacterium]|nr:hypothetical protein [Gemmatimonadota bacterium]